MTQVVLQNLSDGPKVFHDLDRRTFTLKPGEKKMIDIAPGHVKLLDRDAQKENPRVALDMSPLERKQYEKDVAQINAANEKARLTGRVRAVGHAIPTRERLPVTDRRFMTDPQTVHPPLMDTMTDTTEIVKKPTRSRTTKAAPLKEFKTATTVPAPAPTSDKPERVAMKKKKE